ncbi:MAG: NAD(P)/FAD-dependent oxidoreductase [Alphaproteobacteria bacterium]|nr:MAG: NAD(P)/FAD-dependent oxidoreductase [Alphaproteobacteria bacterium]
MDADVVVVGSGINSLVCAGLVAKADQKVVVLERNEVPGGCIRSGEVTVPGFMHDVLSGFHPLFVTSPGYAELGDDLHARGLEYVNTESPTGVVLPDHRTLILKTSRDANISAFENGAPGDGKAYARSVGEIEAAAPLLFGLLGSEPWRWGTARMLAGEAWKNGPLSLARFFGEAMGTCRHWLETEFRSDVARALLAPWILHTGLGPEAPLSGVMGKLIAFTLEAAGMPVVKGGSVRLVDAFRKLIEDNGGQILCGQDVERVIVRNGRAEAVRTAGEEYRARRAVVCNVTPTQLYGRLLSDDHVPARVRQEASRYRYGRGDMQIHVAMDEPPDWRDGALSQVAMLHLTSGLDGVSRAVNEAERGLLPAEATIVLAQPTALDPSRAPDGKWILWLQLQELPRNVKGDAAGEIETPPDGRWTDALKERYADRILERVAVHMPNLKRAMLGRTVLSPADLEALNMNLVGGDPYSGDCGIDQFLLWRPLKSLKNHATPVKQLYHIGASTHPGPGLGGGSGYMVAKHLI